MAGRWALVTGFLAGCAIALPAGAGAGGVFRVEITSGPPSATASTEATFTFNHLSPPPTEIGYRCRLDSGAFESCTSPKTYSGLSVGPHEFAVIAFAGEQETEPDTHAWTVLPPPPQGVRTTQVQGEAQPVRGGKVFKPGDMLRKVPKLRVPKAPEIENEEKEKAPRPTSGVFVVCFSPLVCDEGSPVGGENRSPAPTAAARPVGSRGKIDPQIAASATHLIVVNYNKIRFLSKAGTRVLQTRFGAKLNTEYGLNWVFHDLFDAGPNSVNNGLNLPSGLKCETRVNALDVNEGTVTKLPGGGTVGPADVKDCLLDVYDARAAYDSFRKKFVVIAIVRNGSAGPTYMNASNYPNVAHRVGRRTRVLIGYSKTDDPRDGWNLSWLNGEWGLGECNTVGSAPVNVLPRCPQGHLRPGDAVDYPQLGVSPQGIQIMLNIVNRSPYGSVKASGAIEQTNESVAASYQRLITLPAAPLANGTGAKATGASWNDIDLPLSDGTVPLGLYLGTAPVRQHAPFDFGSAFWITPLYDKGRLVLLEHREGEPYNPLNVYEIPVQGLTLPPNGTPLSGFANQIHSAVQRYGDIVLSLGVCENWTAATSSACTSAIKVVRFPLSFLPNPPAVWDRNFGRRNDFDDPPRNLDYVPYGWSAVDVTIGNDAVISYNREAPGLPTEARYSVWRALEPDLLPSRLLKAGGGNITCGGMSLHDAAIAAEPGSNGGVWMYNTYAKDGCWEYVVGKALGESQADFNFEGLKTVVGPSGVTIGAQIVNDGDGASSAARLSFQVIKTGRGKARKSAARVVRRGTKKLKSVGSGSQKSVRIRIPRKRLGPGRYRIVLRIAGGGPEYSKNNNVIRKKFKVRGRLKARRGRTVPEP